MFCRILPGVSPFLSGDYLDLQTSYVEMYDGFVNLTYFVVSIWPVHILDCARSASYSSRAFFNSTGSRLQLLPK